MIKKGNGDSPRTQPSIVKHLYNNAGFQNSAKIDQLLMKGGAPDVTMIEVDEGQNQTQQQAAQQAQTAMDH